MNAPRIMKGTGDRYEPYRLVDHDGAVVEPVAVFFQELLASGKVPATVRSYGMDLLRWVALPARRRRPVGSGDAGGRAGFQLLDSAEVKPRVNAAAAIAHLIDGDLDAETVAAEAAIKAAGGLKGGCGRVLGGLHRIRPHRPSSCPCRDSGVHTCVPVNVDCWRV